MSSIGDFSLPKLGIVLLQRRSDSHWPLYCCRFVFCFYDVVFQNQSSNRFFDSLFSVSSLLKQYDRNINVFVFFIKIKPLSWHFLWTCADVKTWWKPKWRFGLFLVLIKLLLIQIFYKNIESSSLIFLYQTLSPKCLIFWNFLFQNEIVVCIWKIS